MKRPRHVSPEERALWDLVARRAKPLSPAPRPIVVLAAKPQSNRPAMPDPVPVFRVGQNAGLDRPHNILAPLADRLTAAPVNMDARSFGRMKRGKLVPEGRIDLHGMTLGQAQPALVAFILSAHAAGKRLVLVITGKGRVRDADSPIPTRNGVLRHQVPQWLAMSPIGQAVLQVAPAHLRHGGHGAYYVYLRRR